MESDGKNAKSNSFTERTNEQKLVSILALIVTFIGLPYLVIFVLVPFAFDVMTGNFSNRWHASSEYGETWNALDDEGQRAFVRMDNSMRAKVASLPTDERGEKVRDWWLAEKVSCRYGENPRVDGYKVCRSKRENDLGNWALDQLLEQKK
ncbi:hypothetical protein [Mesorhizobium sp. M0579]|uniref:hypothetical protein n=1 Tax=Mesorhizobium sp. M0579 TaxID=2956962 RepID=UPI003335A5A3